jgi:hypothetical protein
VIELRGLRERGHLGLAHVREALLKIPDAISCSRVALRHDAALTRIHGEDRDVASSELRPI